MKNKSKETSANQRNVSVSFYFISLTQQRGGTEHFILSSSNQIINGEGDFISF